MDDDDDDESVAVVVVLSPRPLRLEEKKVQVDDVSPPKKAEARERYQQLAR